MPEVNITPSKATPTPTKRRSVLGDLGIKPAAGGTVGAGPRTPSSTATKPSPSTNNKPTRAASVSRQSTTPSPPSGPAPTRATSLSRKPSLGGPSPAPRVRKASTATPRPLSVHGTSPSSSGSIASPTTSSRPRPVSMQPQQKPSPRPSATPMSRRSSMNASSSRSGSPRLASSPVDSELKALQEQVAQKDVLMEEQEQRVKELEQQLVTQKEALMKEQDQRVKVLEQQLEDAAPKDPDALAKATEHIHTLEQQLLDLNTSLQDQKAQLDQTEKENRATLITEHQVKLEQVEQAHEQKLAELKLELATKGEQEHSSLTDQWVQEKQTLVAEHQKLEQEQEQKLADLKLELSTKDEGYAKLQSEHEALVRQHQELKDHHAQLEQKVESLEFTLASSKEAKHIRDLEQQLSSARQATEALERRFRDEMQQTQNDHDDTAQTWLETHQRSQTELDRLQQLLVETEQNHAHALAQLRHTNDEQQHDSEERLAQLNEDRDTQAQHMDALEAQIEDLQTRLEEATLRLETATLKPSLSPALSPSPSLTTATTTVTTVDHDLCQQKQKALEHEVTTLQQQLIHQKQQLIDEHQHHMTTLNQKRDDDARTQKDSTNEKLIDVAKQHKKEVQLLHDQYQQLVDLKDQELEAYAYRVKSLNVARQKDLESCRADSTERINHLEYQIEGYEATIHSNNDKLKTLQTQLDQLDQQVKQNQHTIQILTRERGSLRDENDQLIRLVNQLQGELHH